MEKELLQIKSIIKIYKIKDTPEYRKVKDDIEKVKELAYFKSEKKNVICDEGIERILQGVAGDFTLVADLMVNNCALGTTAGHTKTSSQLNAETYRKNISSCSFSGRVLYTTSYYLPTDCSGNFREEGIFLDGIVATANSGYAFSLVDLDATEGDKTINEALLVERVITFR